MADDRRRLSSQGGQKEGSRPQDSGKKKYEEFAVILDYMPRGHPDDKKPPYAREPIIQVVGDTFFTLLELIPKKSVKTPFNIRDRIFIGKGPRSIIDHVKGRISYDELTASAKFELPEVIQDIIKKNELQFIAFFNEARPLTTRMHQLELLPGVGKKLMWDILEERKKQLFKDFKDLSERVKLSHPIQTIEKRIITELQGADKYRVFTRHPPQGNRQSPL
ncbi:MAG: DUF655 domain-containing protein [Promethearchaeota archaeon]|nr:MAG: DUF655 domain-containing protein [Candidatus Lokiarchaeota archaeon]